MNRPERLLLTASVALTKLEHSAVRPHNPCSHENPIREHIMAGQADSLKSIPSDLVDSIKQVGSEFKSKFPSPAWLFFEPDIDD